ncbi:hypothetical protein SDC9_198565 [bioreactor metagenome]|uniref:Uncharacterized protein n=1 Tax=bioreactor metagenome TaxID=1076179 RepID=A0A645II12_9ZZZZ
MCKFIHCFASLFDKEDANTHRSTDDSTGNYVNTKNNIQAKTCAGNITDIKSKTAHDDQSCYKMTKARQNHVGNILTTFPRNTNNAPDIELSTNIKNNG